MKRAGHRQRERRDRRVERMPVFRAHLVGAAHRADGRGDRRAARILEAFAGLQPRLLADRGLAPQNSRFICAPVSGISLRRPRKHVELK